MFTPYGQLLFPASAPASLALRGSLADPHAAAQGGKGEGCQGMSCGWLELAAASIALLVTKTSFH